MKKTSIALATLLPLAAAHAQSSVTLYGVVDAAVSFVDNGTVKNQRVDSAIGPGSRFGLRGLEDLGGGMRAVFTLEGGFDTSTGASQQGSLLFGRQAFTGISSTSGWSVTLGRHYSPTQQVLAVTDALAQNYWGASTGFGNGSQSPGSTALGSGCQGASLRLNNSVLGSWTGNGFTARMLAGAGDENGRGSGRAYNPSLTYSDNALTLAAGYTRMRQCAPDIPALADAAWQTETVVGGSYNFGPAVLYAGYYNFDPAEKNKTIGPSTYLNNKVVWIGARIPVGAVGTVLAQVASLRQDLAAGEAKGVSVGLTYVHRLSTRTSVYASGGWLKNNDRAQFTLAATTATLPAGAVGADPKALSFGVTHTF